MDHRTATDALEAEIIRTRADLDDADWFAPVPSCPDWDVSDLVKHLGRIHRWAATLVRERATQRIDRGMIDFELPHDIQQWGTWFAEGGARLVDALRTADGDAPMWAWGTDQHVRFWSRRQVHETAVHHADLRLALGRDPLLTVDAATAADGIDELLDNLPAAGYFVPGIASLKGACETIHLHATDGGGEWTITLGPDGFTYAHEHGKGTVAVRATTEDLLLLSMNRRTLDRDAEMPGIAGERRYELFGDRALLDHWLANATL